MTNYVILPKQSLFDVAVEVYGSVEGITWILEDNPQLVGPTGPVEAGQELTIREAKIDPRTASALSSFAPFQTIEESHLPTGIDYWKLDNYIIQ